jgi:hypothetical protein
MKDSTNLIERIRRYYDTLPPHKRDRLGGRLLFEAMAALQRTCGVSGFRDTLDGAPAVVSPPAARMEQLLARAAYSAYCEYRGWKSFDGKPLPTWDEVKPDIQAGWQAAVRGMQMCSEWDDLEKLKERR